jgi:hypothetical protein
MPASYQDIRTALRRGFSVDNLRTITNLALKTLQQANPKHPAVFAALASVSRWVADAWDDHAITVKVSGRVEGQLKPRLEALIEVADGSPAEVCGALDDLAVAFRDSIRRGLDSDVAATLN